MKRIYYTIILLSLFIFSCTDLDVKPFDAFGAAQIFNSSADYEQYLAKLYGAYSHTGQKGPAGDADVKIVNDEGFTSYIRSYWKAQELTTDEAVIAWTDAGIRDLNDHIWTSENQFIRVLYYRIYFIVSFCNDFLEQSSEGKLSEYGVPASEWGEIEIYRAEARYLRALAYWHALDLFRNVSVVTSISTSNPSQSTPEATFAFIESELNDIEDVMLAPKTNDYGRADQAALWMLQAKIYLNANVYIGEERYTECLTALNKIINSGYSLEPVYNNLFKADNHLSNELIFTLPADGLNAQNWGSTTFLVHAPIGGSMTDSDYGVTGGWAGLRTTSSMVDKFGTDPANPDDPRAIFYTDGQSLEIDDIGEFTDGIAVPKFQNITSDGTPGSNTTHADTDYPMFRLGDAYLMYAEAVLRGGSGGDQGTALGYINELRERAYGNTSGNIQSTDLTLDFILDERTRELYWEATRRVDLIRYNKYTGGNYIWPWKGGVKEGKSIEDHKFIFPIPASDLIANPNLKQNPNY